MTLKLSAGLLAVIVALAVSIEAPRADAQSMAEAAPEVRVAARGTASGSVEFAIQQRIAGGSWSELLFGSARFMSPRLIALQAWRYASPVSVGDRQEVRVAARGTASGSVEFAIQARGTDGSWGELLFGRLRFMTPRLIALQAWRYASPVNIPGATASVATACVLADNIERVTAATFQVQNADGSSGTAFYIGDGEWITNHHVVETVANTSLVNGETRLSASVEGSLPDHDLALLRADPPSLVPALRFAGSRPPLASRVAVVGFPSGPVGPPVPTDGIVSRYLTHPADGWLLQTSADINPGNSGGPIIDYCGSVVAVVTSREEQSASGRDIDGIGYGVAAETVVAQLDTLRSSPHAIDATPAESFLTVTAFCTLEPSEDLSAEECHTRSDTLDPAQDLWTVWAEGVMDFDDVLYRFNEGDEVWEAGVWDAILALGPGCHELEIAEDGISTHWSPPYEFCFAASASFVPAPPTGLKLTKIDIAFAPDDILVSWNAVPGATHYEVYHHATGTQFVLEARVRENSYRDVDPSFLYYDSYRVRACNTVGCSASSEDVTEQ